MHNVNFQARRVLKTLRRHRVRGLNIASALGEGI